MRAVLTGGAGFLGSHLADRLVSEGWEVVVLDNLITGTTDNLAQHAGNPRLRFILQDVTEYLFVDGHVDVVFHFASPASPVDFERFPIQVLKVGALGTHKALGLARHKGARFMLASTSEVYGDPEITPQPETYWGRVNPIGARGVYDEAKRYAEAMTMAYHNVHGMRTQIVRFFNTYGPRMRTDDGRIVPNFVVQALSGAPLTVHGDGSHTRCFAYVDDVIEAIWRLLQTDYALPVNVGSDEEMTVLEFAHAVLRATGTNNPIEYAPLKPDDPRRRRPDLTLIERLTGWRPTTPLEEGLRRTVEAFAARTSARQPGFRAP